VPVATTENGSETVGNLLSPRLPTMARQLFEFSKPLPLRLRAEDVERLDRLARANGSNRSSLMRQIIARGLDQLEAA
jgi:Ribbon-helix-helix protein, copG family